MVIAAVPGDRARTRLRYVDMARISLLRDIVDSHMDFSVEQWVSIDEETRLFMPDTILELGRGYGNSTCMFVDVAHALGERVISVSNDSSWDVRTKPRLRPVVGDDWFGPLRLIHGDIRRVRFAPLLRGSKRTLVF